MEQLRGEHSVSLEAKSREIEELRQELERVVKTEAQRDKHPAGGEREAFEECARLRVELLDGLLGSCMICRYWQQSSMTSLKISMASSRLYGSSSINSNVGTKAPYLFGVLACLFG